MTFVVTDRLVATHDPVDIHCRAGWCSNDTGTPLPYTHNDGGIVHGDLLDQNGATWTVRTSCPVCGMVQDISHGLDASTFTVIATPVPPKTAAPAKKTAAKKATRTRKATKK